MLGRKKCSRFLNEVLRFWADRIPFLNAFRAVASRLSGQACTQVAANILIYA